MQYKKYVSILPLRNEILFSVEVELLLAQSSVKHHYIQGLDIKMKSTGIDKIWISSPVIISILENFSTYSLIFSIFIVFYFYSLIINT